MEMNRITNSIVTVVAFVLAGVAAFADQEPEGIELMPGVTAGVFLEAEASYEEQGNESSSDIVLSTFELSVDGELTEDVRGHALLLWEEDDSDGVILDEATITIGGAEHIPVYVEVGRQYVPFGAFNNHMVSDPLTLLTGPSPKVAV